MSIEGWILLSILCVLLFGRNGQENRFGGWRWYEKSNAPMPPPSPAPPPPPRAWRVPPLVSVETYRGKEGGR